MLYDYVSMNRFPFLCYIVLREMEEFEKLFQKKAQTKRNKNASHVTRECNVYQPVRLLDGQRSQAVAIVMKSLHVDVEEITQALIAMDVGVVDVESLRALNEMVSNVTALMCQGRGGYSSSFESTGFISSL